MFRHFTDLKWTYRNSSESTSISSTSAQLTLLEVCVLPSTMQINSALWILGLLSLNNTLLILQYSDACSRTPDNELDEKWEALREPWLRKRALEITQKQMLNVLGLTEIPRPNRRVIRPHAFMVDLYKSLSRGANRETTKREIQQQSINTVRGVVDQGQ